MQDLKLIAMDSEDLAVISAQLQDAVLKVDDIAYLPRENRFAALANRFNWAAAMDDQSNAAQMTRHRCALRIDRITSARLQGIDLAKKDEVLALLTIQFVQLTEDDPAGQMTLIFAGGGAIQFDVECIEVELRDLGGAWATTSRPDHTRDETASD